MGWAWLPARGLKPEPCNDARQLAFSPATLPGFKLSSGEYRWLERLPPLVSQSFVGAAKSCCAENAGASWDPELETCAWAAVPRARARRGSNRMGADSITGRLSYHQRCEPIFMEYRHGSRLQRSSALSARLQQPDAIRCRCVRL